MQSHKYYNHTNNEHYVVEYNGRKICVCQLCTCGKIYVYLFLGNHKICPQNSIKQSF